MERGLKKCFNLPKGRKYTHDDDRITYMKNFLISKTMLFSKSLFCHFFSVWKHQTVIFSVGLISCKIFTLYAVKVKIKPFV